MRGNHSDRIRGVDGHLCDQQTFCKTPVHAMDQVRSAFATADSRQDTKQRVIFHFPSLVSRFSNGKHCSGCVIPDILMASCETARLPLSQTASGPRRSIPAHSIPSCSCSPPYAGFSSLCTKVSLPVNSAEVFCGPTWGMATIISWHCHFPA
jgi:hypothetical protein